MSHEKIYPIKLYLKYKVSWLLIGLALLLNVATWIWLAVSITPQENAIYLHYNILFGIDYIGEWWRVFGVPATGTAILLVNFLIGWFLFAKDKFVSLVVNSISLICQIFLLVMAGLLIFLNA